MTDAQKQVAVDVGRAIARDARADGWPTDWTGLDAQDGDQLSEAGIEPGTAEWDEAASIAAESYAAALSACTCPPPCNYCVRCIDVGHDHPECMPAKDCPVHGAP